MPQTTLEEIYKSPWGVVGHRRRDIESGPFGTLDRILREEVERAFLPIDRVAELMSAHPSTARRWLAASDPLYVVTDGRKLYRRDDVAAVIAARAESKRKAAEIEVAS